MPRHRHRQISVGTAILLATAAGLVGCADPGDIRPETDSTAATPVAAGALPGPIALAPELTGAPPPSQRTDPTAAAIAAVLAGPVPAAGNAPAAGAIATFGPAPTSCPPDTVGVWAGPDAAGAPVFLCRRPKSVTHTNVNS